jgi:hypothetical protein
MGVLTGTVTGGCITEDKVQMSQAVKILVGPCWRDLPVLCKFLCITLDWLVLEVVQRVRYLPGWVHICEHACGCVEGVRWGVRKKGSCDSNSEVRCT